LHRSFLASLAAVLAASPAGAGDPKSADELARDLGSPSFAVREQASKALWKLGPAAHAAVREAARSGDPEVRTRAAALLDKFDWGIFPDTPATVVIQVREFRTGELEKQVAAVDALLKLDRPGQVALRIVLSRKIENERRPELFSGLADRLRSLVPPLIVTGKLDAAEALLELNTLGPCEYGQSDYAVFMRLLGKLPAAAARLEAARNSKDEVPAGDAAVKGLVFVYRLEGKSKESRAAAAAVADPAEARLLRESLLEDQGAWAELAQMSLDEDVQSRVGLEMFRHRMAGDKSRVNALAVTAMQAAHDDGLHSGPVYEAALGLFLNGRPLDGIALLRAKRAQPHLLADVLAARLEFREALDLIGEGQTARAADEDADPRLRAFYATRKARLLAQIGETDDAVQQFNKTAEALRSRDQYTIQQLLRAEVRAGRLDLAAEHAAKFLHQFEQADQGFYVRPGPFEILFEGDCEAARGWWLALRLHGPKESPGLTIKWVRELLSGKASAKQFAEALDAISAGDKDERLPNAPIPLPTRATPQPNLKALYAQSLAAAYRAAGKVAAAEKELVRAADATKEEESDLETYLGGTGPRAWVFGTDERYRPWLDLGDFLYDAGRFAEAAKRYEEGWRRFPENPILLYLAGRALTKAGDEPGGRRRMDLAHWVPLGNARLRGRFLEELCNRGLLVSARREVELTRQTVWYWEKFRGNVWNEIGRASVLLKDFPGAAAAADRAMYHILRTTGVTFVEGSAYMTVPAGVKVFEARRLLAEGKPDAALAAVRECLAVLPGHADSVTPVVPELDKLGRTADADALFRSVWDVYREQIQEHPKSAWSHNASAALAAGCRRELDAALASAKTAAELEPEVKGYRETLAEVHFRRGEREVALTLMRDLAKADPRNHLYKRQLVRYATGDVGSPLPTGGED
jgi:tetratricopeptide (TPR) repeat protein